MTDIKEQVEQSMQNIQDQNLMSNKPLQINSQDARHEQVNRYAMNKLKKLMLPLRIFFLTLVVISGVVLTIYLAQKHPEQPVHRDTNFNCHLHPQYEEYIYKSLEYFSTGITQSMVDKTKNFKYKIVINVTDGAMSYSHASQEYFREEWIIFMRECAKVLPDSYFTISFIDEPRILRQRWTNNTDWAKSSCDKDYQIPQDHSFFKKPCMFEPHDEKIPLFSFGVISECFADILFPSHYHIPVKKFENQIAWEQKSFKAIWRGRLTGISYDYNDCCWPMTWNKKQVDLNEFHRPKLVNLCRNISDCDADFSIFNVCNPLKEQKLAQSFQKVAFMKMEQQIKFKLLIDIDGYTYSQRFPELLTTGSAIIKIHSFQDIGSILAKPWVHYIPVKIDLSDLEEKIQWAKENDDQVNSIASRGLELSKVYTREQYKCYIFKLISLYTKLFVSEEQYEINEQRRRLQEEKGLEATKMCSLNEAFEKQIAEDLAPFRLGIPPSMVKTAKEQRGVDIVRIHNHSAEISGSGMSEEQRSFLQDVAGYLPDMEFVVNPGPQPRALKYNYLKGGIKEKFLCDNGFEKPKHGLFLQPCNWNPIYEFVPIFGPSKVPECFLDILLPTGTAPRLQAGIGWKDKKLGSIWRGASEGGNFGGFQCQKIKEGGKQIPFQNFNRQRLVEICSKTKDCDAKFTEYSQCSDPNCGKMRAMYGKQVEKQTIKDQAHHKAIIDIDGNGHSREFIQKLASGSAVLKISAFLDFPLIAAQPWVHFIPVRADLEDLTKQLQWARDNDEELEKIALRGKELARKQLDYSSQKCYAIRVLREYSRLLIPEDRYRARLKIKQEDSQYQP